MLVLLSVGHIPLRELVYRVLDLPPSMRPLVYDFGQLKKDTEDDYIKQIVHDHVSGISFDKPDSFLGIIIIIKLCRYGHILLSRTKILELSQLLLECWLLHRHT